MNNNDIFKFKTLSRDKTKCEATLQNINNSIKDKEELLKALTNEKMF